jgi:hypothetical protein
MRTLEAVPTWADSAFHEQTTHYSHTVKVGEVTLSFHQVTSHYADAHHRDFNGLSTTTVVLSALGASGTPDEMEATAQGILYAIRSFRDGENAA